VKAAPPKAGEGALPLDNERLADRLAEVADLLEGKGENPYRVRAYRRAADTLRRLGLPASELLRAEGLGALERLPGFGRGLARVVEELATTGRLGLLDELRGEVAPEELLAGVAGLGPALAARVHRELGVRTLEGLERAAHDGRLAALPGFGPKRLRAVREALAGRLRRRPAPEGPSPAGAEPPVADLLDVDREYRERAAGGELHRLAPRRFNPRAEAWLPVLRARRGGRRYTALYSNTPEAHAKEKTRDWVVIYEQGGAGRQWTVVTARSGPLRGRRVVRGREKECREYYAAG
jgi:DNA polymerase (family X)